MIENYQDFDAFRKAVDPSKPTHYLTQVGYLDQYRIMVGVGIEVSGVSREHGWIVKFRVGETLDKSKYPQEDDFNKEALGVETRLVETYAKPLNATKGYYE